MPNGTVRVSGRLTGTLSPKRQLTGGVSVPAKRALPSDYETLINKPRIEGNVLEGDKTYAQLGLDEITPQDIDEIIFGG